MITVNAMGDACPMPVVKTKQAILSLAGTDTVEVLVDNEIAVQNLSKMAKQMGFSDKSEKISDSEYKVIIEVTGAIEKEETAITSCLKAEDNKVVVIRSAVMGVGNDELGKVLIKGFIYALSQQEDLPETMLFYNGGATITCEGSESLEDLKSLEEKGVEILTCGTCLNYYGLSEKLAVGEVTNMYTIAEKMSKASLIIEP